MKILAGFLIAAPLWAAACSEDPQYVQAPLGIEVGTGNPDDTGMASERVILPIDAAKLADPDVVQERQDLADRLGIDVGEVSELRLDHVSLSVEWTIKNLSPDPGQARVHLNGGNERYYYVPDDFIVVDPGNNEESPAPPPLAGDIPIDVPGDGTVSGVFREDQLREAAIDLELITRGGVNAFAAVLTVNEDITSTADVAPDPLNPTPPTAAIPIEAFGAMVQFDVTFEADQHMILEYAIRVRDHRGLLHDEGLDAPAGELVPFAPAEFIPPPPVAP
ncbi:MAG: hypothetical protein H6709_14135 [Kofleriaceae bacterium]|nr:hypothetical protein [Myxococcales bacterium]MCB9573220.1 hypothetical protein [Kofleriaceae bacterium]